MLACQINAELDVYCAGGKQPPRNCPSDFYVHSPDYGACVCKDGYVDPDGLAGAQTCRLCAPGHYCVGGVERECAIHTFQVNAGATACQKCSSTGDEYGIYTECGDKQQLTWCLPGKSDSLSANCVACSRCKRAYLSASEEQVNCYRSA
jgi:hypothetical protein